MELANQARWSNSTVFTATRQTAPTSDKLEKGQEMPLCTGILGNFSSSKVSTLIKAVKTFIVHSLILLYKSSIKQDTTDFFFQFSKDEFKFLSVRYAIMLACPLTNVVQHVYRMWQ